MSIGIIKWWSVHPTVRVVRYQRLYVWRRACLPTAVKSPTHGFIILFYYKMRTLPKRFIRLMNFRMYAAIVFVNLLAIVIGCQYNTCSCIAKVAVCGSDAGAAPHFSMRERYRIQYLVLSSVQKDFTRRICSLFPRIVSVEGVCATLLCANNTCR